MVLIDRLILGKNRNRIRIRTKMEPIIVNMGAVARIRGRRR